VAVHLFSPRVARSTPPGDTSLATSAFVVDEELHSRISPHTRHVSPPKHEEAKSSDSVSSAPVSSLTVPVAPVSVRELRSVVRDGESEGLTLFCCPRRVGAVAPQHSCPSGALASWTYSTTLWIDSTTQTTPKCRHAYRWCDQADGECFCCGSLLRSRCRLTYALVCPQTHAPGHSVSAPP